MVGVDPGDLAGLLLLRFLGDGPFDGLLLWTTAQLAGQAPELGPLAVASLVGAGYGLRESLAALGMVPLSALAAPDRPGRSGVRG